MSRQFRIGDRVICNGSTADIKNMKGKIVTISEDSGLYGVRIPNWRGHDLDRFITDGIRDGRWLRNFHITLINPHPNDME